jgi:hypothetical protein
VLSNCRWVCAAGKLDGAIPELRIDPPFREKISLIHFCRRRPVAWVGFPAFGQKMLI